MKNLGWYNGTYDLLENMTIPMNDRVCYFGDGVYDALISRNYVPYYLDEHIERFFRSASLVDIEVPMSKQELHDLVLELMKKVDSDVQFIYFQVTRNAEGRLHTYEKGPGNLWITLRPSAYNLCEKTIQCVTRKDKRFEFCHIKTLNLLPSVLYSQEAKKLGCYETILYRDGGRVTECAHSNCHILKDGKFITAPTDEWILPGIQRAHLISAAKELGILVEERPYTLEELRDADEILVSDSANFALRVDTLDGAPAGMKDSPLYEKLRAAVVNEFLTYTQIVNSRIGDGSQT